MAPQQRKLELLPGSATEVVDSTAQPIAAAQRVRVGLTGLAAIFLLVLVAAAGLRPGVPRNAPQATGEPLAVLGVAPTAPDDRPQTDATNPR